MTAAIVVIAVPLVRPVLSARLALPARRVLQDRPALLARLVRPA